MQKDVLLTPEGLQKLKDEIEYLSGDKRREVAERIKEAREFGDISENSEYDDAKNEQARLETRIASLEDKLRSATVIDASELDNDVVRVGRRSTSRTGRQALTYKIVGSAEADPRQQGSPTSRPWARRCSATRRATRSRSSAAPARSSSRSPRSRSLTATSTQAGGEAELLAIRRPSSMHSARTGSTLSRTPTRTSSRSPRSRRRSATRTRRRDRGRRRVAGRLAARREQGKAASSTSSTAPGASSCLARVNELGEEALRRLLEPRPRRLVGAEGTVLRTRRGELSVRAEGLRRCSPSRCARCPRSATAS